MNVMQKFRAKKQNEEKRISRTGYKNKIKEKIHAGGKPESYPTSDTITNGREYDPSIFGL